MQEIAEHIGKYKIRSVLGRGTMGEVYKAEDPVIGRLVAVKTIKPLAGADIEPEEQLARFKREAQASGRLLHPNIVAIYEYGEDENGAYIAMEFVEGASLNEFFEQRKDLSLEEIVRVVSGILAGLGFSHGKGVIHRDIKPANIMISHDGEVKIADFGIARIESSNLTQVNTLMGTPGYMSPEQVMAGPVDNRSDLYAVGVLLYQLLTGRKPFSGDTNSVLYQVVHSDPPPPSQVNPKLPRSFDALVAKACAKDPDARFQDANAFIEALQNALVQSKNMPAVEEDDDEATQIVRKDAVLNDIDAYLSSTTDNNDNVNVAGKQANKADEVSKKPLILKIITITTALLGLAAAGWYVFISKVPDDMQSAPKPITKQNVELSPADEPVALPSASPVKKDPELPQKDDHPITDDIEDDKPFSSERNTPQNQQETETIPGTVLPVETKPSEQRDPIVPFELFLKTLDENNGIYQLGDEMTLELSLNHTGSVFCFYRMFDGSMLKIFPNRFHVSPKLQANKPLLIPGPDMGFSFTFEEPGAVDEIRCYAAENDWHLDLPQEILDEDLVPLTNISEFSQLDDLIFDASRGMAVQKNLIIRTLPEPR